MGMVTVTVCYEVAGEFLDWCENTIVRVQQDDVRRVCRFVLHVPEMMTCEAEVVVVTRDDGSQTAWLVPVVPSNCQPIFAPKLTPEQTERLKAEWDRLHRGPGS